MIRFECSWTRAAVRFKDVWFLKRSESIWVCGVTIGFKIVRLSEDDDDAVSFLLSFYIHWNEYVGLVNVAFRSVICDSNKRRPDPYWYILNWNNLIRFNVTHSHFFQTTTKFLIPIDYLAALGDPQCMTFEWEQEQGTPTPPPKKKLSPLTTHKLKIKWHNAHICHEIVPIYFIDFTLIRLSLFFF